MLQHELLQSKTFWAIVGAALMLFVIVVAIAIGPGIVGNVVRVDLGSAQASAYCHDLSALLLRVGPVCDSFPNTLFSLGDTGARASCTEIYSGAHEMFQALCK